MSDRFSRMPCESCCVTDFVLSPHGLYCSKCGKYESVESSTQRKAPISQKMREEMWLKNVGDKFYGNCTVCKLSVSVFDFIAEFTDDTDLTRSVVCVKCACARACSIRT